MLQTNQNILLTTAISYTNGSPHIGHLYESILADFIKKVHKVLGYDIKLLTGTDEHGKKIQTSAIEQNLEPIELCNKYSNEFVQMNKNIGTEYDYFIRTTEPTHKNLVSESIQYVLTNQNVGSPSLYLTEYSGYYNVREECFITELQASQDNYIDPITSKPYEIIKEPTWKFVLDKHIDKIKKITNKIIPSHFQEEIKVRIEKGIDDLSITRTGFNWGIPFPNPNQNPNPNPTDITDISNHTHTHIVYVWFDALLNYITGKNILYPNANNNVKLIHLIGKDIIWFHSVIYPAILEACGIDENIFPDKILTHGFVLDKDGKKMSKSVGNIITNDYLIKTYPIDAIRYYFISNTVLGQDFKFDPNYLIELYNNTLIKNFGNLFQRLLKIIKPIQKELNESNANNIKKITLLKKEYANKINEFLITYDFSYYNEILMMLITNANKILTERKPWTLELPNQVEILSEILVNFNIGMCLMYPIIPNKIIELAKIFDWDSKLGLDINDVNIKIDESIGKIIAFEQIKK